MQNPASQTMTYDQAFSIAEGHYNAGRLAAAQQICLEITRQVPDVAGGWVLLGLTLVALGQLDDAQSAYDRALQINSQSWPAWCNLGMLLRIRGKLDEAVDAVQRAAALVPTHPGVLCNLATVLLEAGHASESLAVARRGLAADPSFTYLHDALIMVLHYDSATMPQDIRQELDRWQACFAEPLRSSIQPHANDRNPTRRLRIGYLSPDFGQHSVGRFMAPLLAAHDPQAVETFGYANVLAPDPMTAHLQTLAHAWRPILGMSDQAVADQIRDDRIDILVDLAMHTANNRLLVFARKPAPVQVTWLAYPGSSGLSAIDYRLSDDVIDPPDSPNIYVEKTKLLETYWCYQTSSSEPVGPLPADRGRGVTFGSLNMSAKLSDAAVSTWGQILARVPNSRLLLHARVGGQRQRILATFARQSVSPDRITFLERMPLIDFLRLHAEIDIALDTFPFCGGTTTCDSLWMGVPVVSLRGPLPVGRSGASLLTHVGLPELIADSPEGYVQCAVDLAADLPRLRELRSTLRQRMRNSVLMDAPRFARRMECLFREMWIKWCEEGS
jgi:predicted O-linked N-acetylglucosamine transferase (SPINDLY family)